MAAVLTLFASAIVACTLKLGLLESRNGAFIRGSHASDRAQGREPTLNVEVTFGVVGNYT